MRNQIRDRNNSDMTGADFYKDIMSVLLDHPDELIELAMQLKEKKD
jgi:hypothetical protein